jgi:hypothetical protein
LKRFLGSALVATALAAWGVPLAAEAAGTGLALATGCSAAEREDAAVQEAATGLVKKVAHPKLVLLFGTVGYDMRAVLARVDARFPRAKVFGVTSCRAVVTEAGVLFARKKGALALAGLDGDDLAVGVATAPIQGAGQARLAARALALKAIADAGKALPAKPALVLIGSTPGLEERALEGIEGVLGKDVPIYGGSAADDDISGKWLALGNARALSSGLSLAVIYTRHPIGSAFACGYLGGSHGGTVTAGRGRTIASIDGRPAGEVYNAWSKGAFAANMRDGSPILAKSSFLPLAKAIVTRTGERHFVSLHPARIDPKSKALELFGEADVHKPIYFLQGDPGRMIGRVSLVTRRAMVEGRIKRDQVVGGIHIYCAGTMLAVKDRIGEIVPQINGVLGNKPFIGAFTFGEQGAFKGYGNFHGNLMSATVVLGGRRGTPAP